MVWGFSPAAVAANSARDVGGRLAVLTLWGTPAAGGSYAAIAALTNIPATIAGGIFYYFIFSDSDRGKWLAQQHCLFSQLTVSEVITPAALELTAASSAYEQRGRSDSTGTDYKGDVEFCERVVTK